MAVRCPLACCLSLIWCKCSISAHALLPTNSTLSSTRSWCKMCTLRSAHTGYVHRQNYVWRNQGQLLKASGIWACMYILTCWYNYLPPIGLGDWPRFHYCTVWNRCVARSLCQCSNSHCAPYCIPSINHVCFRKKQAQIWTCDPLAMQVNPALKNQEVLMYSQFILCQNNKGIYGIFSDQRIKSILWSIRNRCYWIHKPKKHKIESKYK